MALQWLNDTPRAVSAADAGLATGTHALWWQARIKGSFLLDLPVNNNRYMRFAAFTDDPWLLFEAMSAHSQSPAAQSLAVRHDR